MTASPVGGDAGDFKGDTVRQLDNILIYQRIYDRVNYNRQ